MPASASRFRPRLPCAVALGLGATAGGAAGGCAPRDPMLVIPRAERGWLQAEARLAQGRAVPAEAASGGQGAISVAELLGRARGGAEAAPAVLTLRFPPGVAEPDAAQRRAIAAYAAAREPGERLMVAAAAGGHPPLLAERRAVAVARLLEPRFPEVELRFGAGAARADEVQVTRAMAR